MQFLLMIIADEAKPLPPPAELEKLGQAYRVFTEALANDGRLRAAVRLHPSASARTVRERRTSAGPFTKGSTQLAGYFLVECADLDEAAALAARIPGVRLGEAVEVRPAVPLAG